MADETRLRILNLLTGRECCVCEVMQALNFSQTRASRNLGILYDAGFLNMRREGLWAFYSIKPEDTVHFQAELIRTIKIALKDEVVLIDDLERLRKARRLSPNQCYILLKIKPPLNCRS